MSQSEPIKLIAVDVDGTLLDSNHELSPRGEAALRKAIAQGVEVVLATGKTRNSTVQLIEKLGLNAHGIYLQGVTIYDADGKIQWQQTLDPAVARQIITFAEDRGFSMIAYNGTRMLMRSSNEKIYDGMVKYHEPLPETVGSLQNIINDLPIHKLIALGEPAAIKALRWQLNQQVGGRARLVQAGVPEMVEILPPNASKGTALRQLLKILRLSADSVLAIGDAENDIEMIQLARIGVAMGNAPQFVKDAADDVTASNDEDGFAQALEKYVLPPEAPAASKPAAPAKSEPSTGVKSVRADEGKTKAETPETTP